MPADAELLRLQLGLVLEIGHAINAPAPLPNTLNAVCAAARSFGWERAAVVLWEATDSGVKTWRAASGPDAEGGDRLAAEVAARGRDVFDAFESRDVATLGEAAGRDGLAVLIRSGGEPYGVLALADPTSENATEPAAVDLLRKVGEMAAVAMRCARFADALGARDVTDPLTHLANRKGFEESLRREMERAYRGLVPLSVIVVDVDRLERVNQTNGREAGDAAIRTVAHVLLEGLRQVDIAAHLGSGHFQILLPGATSDGAREVAERLRCAVAAAKVPGVGTITATFGVAVLNEHAANGAGLMQAAAAALDIGKRRGRNRVSLALPIGRR
jgi:diguanylate cyclase (GGDEF)-like protein